MVISGVEVATMAGSKKESKKEREKKKKRM